MLLQKRLIHFTVIFYVKICHIDYLSTVWPFFCFSEFFDERVFFFCHRDIHSHSFLHGLHKYVITLHIYMPSYTMLYTAYCILLLSDNFRKGPAESMNSNGQGKPLAMQATSNHAIRSFVPELML